MVPKLRPDRWFGHLRWPLSALILYAGSLFAAAPLSPPRPQNSPTSPPASPAPTESARPEGTIAAYRSALERDDPEAAYRLLSPTLQQHLPYEKWVARWKETTFERDAQRKQLAADPKLALQAAITLPQGTVLLMAPNPARTATTRWQVAEPDLATVHAETPEQALHLLMQAVEQRNYFAILRLLSASERKALEAELRERAERLRQSLARPKPGIEVRGDRVHFQYDPRFFIDLVRERDGWRVLDLN